MLSSLQTPRQVFMLFAVLICAGGCGSGQTAVVASAPHEPAAAPVIGTGSGAQVNAPTTPPADQAISLTRAAADSLRKNRYGEAKRLSERALDTSTQLPPRLVGLNEYVIGTAFNAMGQDTKAVRAYEAAVSGFNADGPASSPDLAYVYCDLAMTFIRTGNIRSAERTLNQSASVSAAGARGKLVQFMRRDVLAHLQYSQGRLSD
jgi:hypothetical protein